MRASLAIALVLTLAVRTAARAQADLPRWNVDPQPVLEVGMADALDAEMFIRATDAVLLDSGGVAVLDVDGGRVRTFAASGRPVTVFGREGEGPGEWIAPFAIEMIRDTVVVWDYRRAVLSLWSPDGVFLEERRIAHHPTFHEGTLLPDGSLLIPYYGENGTRPPAEGRYRPYADLLHYTRGETHDLGPFPFDEMIVDAPVQPSYPARSIAAGGGWPLRLYVGDDTNEPHVRRYDARGVLIDTLFLLDTRRRPNDGDLERLAAERFVVPGREAAARRALAASGDPERTPAYEDLVVDDAGRLWVLSRDGGGRWQAIVYEDGRPVASLQLPPHRNIVEIRERRIVLIATGALDEDIVRVYAYGGG